MATPSTIYNGTQYQEVEVFTFASSAIFSATSFLAYSHIILLDREIQNIWMEPLRPASWIYALARYPIFFSQLIYTCINSYTPGCDVVLQLSDWLQVIAMMAVYTFQILRTYAVCGKSKALIGLLVVLATPALVDDILTIIKVECVLVDPRQPQLEAVAAVADLVFETVVLCTTIWGTWSQITNKDSRLSRNTITNTILRNGILYYGVCLAPQLCRLVTDILPSSATVTKFNLFGKEFILPLRCVVTCQFILELRARSERLSGMSGVSLATMSIDLSQPSSIDFLHVAIERDFGEPLAHPMHSLDWDESHEDIGLVDVTGSALSERGETHSDSDSEFEGFKMREWYLAQS